MKRRWIVLLLLFMTIGAAGYGFTREEAQKVQKTSSLKIQAVYLECESEEANPLLEDAVLEGQWKNTLRRCRKRQAM